MFCKKCGKEVDDTSKFCINCGVHLNKYSSESIQAELTFNNETNTFTHKEPEATNDNITNNQSIPKKRSSDVGIKVFLIFVGCLFLILIVLLVSLAIPAVNNVNTNNNVTSEVDENIEIEEIKEEDQEDVLLSKSIVEEVEETEHIEAKEVATSYTFVEDSSYGMSYSIPSTYKKQTFDSNDYIYYYFDGETDGFIMIMSPRELDVDTLSDFVWASIVKGIATAEGYIQLYDVNYKIDGIDARIHNYSLDRQGIKYNCSSAVFILNGMCYVISMTVEDYNYDEYYPIFESVLDSIELD